MNDVTELIGKDVYVKPGKYYDQPRQSEQRTGRRHPDSQGNGRQRITTRKILITQVAQGKIPYTVADNDLAKLNTPLTIPI